MQMIEGLLHGDGAQGAAADTQHHEGIELLADAGSGLFDMGDDFLLIIGQLSPAQPAGAAGGLNSLIGRGGKGRILLHLATGNAILEAQGIGHHVIHVQLNRLFAHICHWYSSFPATLMIRQSPSIVYHDLPLSKRGKIHIAPMVTIHKRTEGKGRASPPAGCILPLDAKHSAILIQD